MNKTRRRNLLKKLRQVKLSISTLPSGAWRVLNIMDSLFRIEKRIVSEFPDNELPLLIAQLETKEASNILEKRLMKG